QAKLPGPPARTWGLEKPGWRPRSSSAVGSAATPAAFHGTRRSSWVASRPLFCQFQALVAMLPSPPHSTSTPLAPARPPSPPPPRQAGSWEGVALVRARVVQLPKGEGAREGAVRPESEDHVPVGLAHREAEAPLSDQPVLGQGRQPLALLARGHLPVDPPEDV